MSDDLLRGIDLSPMEVPPPITAQGWIESPGFKAWLARHTLGTNPPEWTIPLGWDERWSKI